MSLTPKQTVDMLVRIFRMPERKVVVYLSGAPGIGKNAVIDQARVIAGLSGMVVFPLPACENVDVRGMMYRSEVNGEQRTLWASPLPRTGSGVVVMDEAPSAMPDVQVALHHVLHVEAGSDMTLPLAWHLILTGNRANDKTLYRAPSAPFRNRIVEIKMEADVESWVEWGMTQTDLPTDFFGMFRDPSMQKIFMAKQIPPDGAWNSPRSWAQASEILRIGLSKDAETEAIMGCVGDGPGTEAMAWLKTTRNLPSIVAMLQDAKKCKIPTEPSQLYALTTGAAAWTIREQQSAMELIARFPAEYAHRYVMDIVGKFNDLATDPDIKAWVGKHKNHFKAFGL